MRRKIVISAALVVAIATIGGVLALTQTSKGKAPSTAAAPPTVPVVAETVAQHDVPIYLRGVGTVIAYNTVVVRSPIQGQITKIAFTEEQPVHAGDLIAQIDPCPYHAQLDQGTAKGPLTVLAYSQDNTIKLDEGKLNLVHNEILQTTGTIRLKADFPNTAHRLWPGELINAWLLLDTRHNGLTVSASAVQQGSQGSYVYVINADNTVAVRPVAVAQVSGGQALIDQGLTANEQVVVDGQYKLQPGARGNILHGQAAEEAAAQHAQKTPIP